ncbi:MAG: GHKL domain-containing protein [Coriobacteriales bacterium]|nr:GHKL domain-containing protein [Coriobacteriales bacterium]
MGVFAKRFDVALSVVVLLLALVMAAVSLRSQVESADNARTITDAQLVVADKDAQAVHLPYTASGLKSRTKVSITFPLECKTGDLLLVHVAYAPTRIYQDGELVESLGAQGSYPAILKDPPTYVVSIPLSGASPTTVRIEYDSPSVRSSLKIYAPQVGSSQALLDSLFGECGLLMVMGIICVLAGLVLVVSSLFFLSFESRGHHILHLGAFLFGVGLWQFAENTLTGYLLQEQALLYMLSFMGFFYFPAALIKIAGLLSEHDQSPFFVVLHRAYLLLVALAYALQATGVVPFSQSMYLFHAIAPLTIAAMFVYLLVAGIRDRDRRCLRVSLSLLVLTTGAFLELLNYYVRFTDRIASIFQLTLIVLVPFIWLLAGVILRKTMRDAMRSRELSASIELLERSLGVQRERNRLMLEHEEVIRRQRHDLRQHLYAMGDLLEAERYDELKEYLTQIEGAIPSNPVTNWCENSLVNALLAHYVSRAEDHQTKLGLVVRIPAQNPHLSDADLCVVVGNLLENALDASEDLEPQQRMVTFNANTQGDMLIVYVENRFAGSLIPTEEGFGSTKHSGEGVGLRSVRTIAERNGGYARFEAHGQSFASHVILRR